MYLSDQECEEWHRLILRQRNEFKEVLRDIVIGVPVIRGMASEYRKLSMEEIRKAAKEALEHYE